MTNFKKVLSFGIISPILIFLLSLEILFLSDQSLYAFQSSKEFLRIPMTFSFANDKKLASGHTTRRRDFLAAAAALIGPFVPLLSEAANSQEPEELMKEALSARTQKDANIQGSSLEKMRRSIKKDLDIWFEFFDVLYQNPLPLTLEEVTTKIGQELYGCHGLIFGEMSHFGEEDNETALHIIRSISPQRPIAIFLEETGPPRKTGNRPHGIFTNPNREDNPESLPYLEALQSMNIRHDNFVPLEQFNPHRKIRSSLKAIKNLKRSGGEGEPLLVTYTGSGHATRILSSYINVILERRGDNLLVDTIEEIFQNENKNTVILAMINEETLFYYIESIFLRKIFQENSNPDVMLAKARIFRQLWDEKMAKYPKSDTQYFLQHPVNKNIYFGIIPGNRQPQHVQAFELAINKTPGIREGFEQSKITQVSVTRWKDYYPSAASPKKIFLHVWVVINGETRDIIFSEEEISKEFLISASPISILGQPYQRRDL